MGKKKGRGVRKRRLLGKMEIREGIKYKKKKCTPIYLIFCSGLNFSRFSHRRILISKSRKQWEMEGKKCD